MAFSIRSALFAAGMALSSPLLSSAMPSGDIKNLHKRADTVTIMDASYTAPCGLGNCCSPVCKAYFTMDSGDCPDKATKEWGQSCSDVFKNQKAGEKSPFTTKCDGWSVFWEDGAVDGGRFITVENDETGKYYQYFVGECKDTDFSWDPFQCAAIGGGCEAKISGRGTNPDKAGK
ncbi:hypothetical protein FLONG3_7898 [Fusarium longipes]|uniref:Small secreted n=1 Tax=Fusarium longipes TaxID=694270 RepID=A0A395SAZ6_9HYPO|nr:hypothetical protein FLONG3_7898 [Fusarium longipes]